MLPSFSVTDEMNPSNNPDGAEVMISSSAESSSEKTGSSRTGAWVVEDVVSKTASLRLLNPELTWLNPDWKKLRVVVMTSSAEVLGSAVVVEIVVERMVVDGVDANVVAAVDTDDAVLLMRRSSK